VATLRITTGISVVAQKVIVEQIQMRSIGEEETRGTEVPATDGPHPPHQRIHIMLGT